MIATILLVIRFAISLVLYSFIGWAFYLLWQDFRAQARRISSLQTPPLTLVFESPLGEEIRQFVHSPITIGRDPSCDCRLDDSTVSVRHAGLSYHHSQWWIEDLNSTNGTLLNGETVDAAAVLTNSDQLRCGQVEMKILISLGDGIPQSTMSKRDFLSE